MDTGCSSTAWASRVDRFFPKRQPAPPEIRRARSRSGPPRRQRRIDATAASPCHGDLLHEAQIVPQSFSPAHLVIPGGAELQPSDSVLQDILCGRAVPFVSHPLAATVSLWTQQAYNTPHKASLSTVKVAEHLFQVRKHNEPVISSLTDIGRKCNLNRSSAKSNVCRLGALLVLCDREDRKEIEHAIVKSKPDVELMHSLEMDMYDETPLSLKLRGWAANGMKSLLAEELKLDTGDVDAASLTAQLPMDLKKRMSVDAGPSKLMQIRNVWAHLLRVHLADGGIDYCIISGRGKTHLQCMDRCTGETSFQALLNTRGGSIYALGSEQSTRVAVADRCKENPRAERGMRNSYPSVQSMAKDCIAHIEMSMKTVAFAFLPFTVRGMLRSSKSLRMPATMSRFRSFCRAMHLPRIKFFWTDCTEEQNLWRLRSIRLFTSDVQDTIIMLIARHMFPNRNWQNQECIEFQLPGEPDDYSEQQLAAIRENVMDGIIFCFFSRAPPQFARHHWTGHAEAVCWYGQSESCHALWSLTYPGWSRSMGTTSAKAQRQSAKTTSRALASPNLAILPIAMPDEQSTQAFESPTVDAQTCSAELNAEDRRISTEWSLSNPLFGIQLMRLALRVLAPIDELSLTQSGHNWEAIQQQKVLIALKDGLSATDALKSRQFALTELASGRVVQKAMGKLRDLFETTDLWSLTPSTRSSEANNAFVFKLLSRLGCVIHELLVTASNELSVCVFLLIHATDEEEIDDIIRRIMSRPCLQGVRSNIYRLAVAN